MVSVSRPRARFVKKEIILRFRICDYSSSKEYSLRRRTQHSKTCTCTQQVRHRQRLTSCLDSSEPHQNLRLVLLRHVAVRHVNTSIPGAGATLDLEVGIAPHAYVARAVSPAVAPALARQVCVMRVQCARMVGGITTRALEHHVTGGGGYSATRVMRMILSHPSRSGCPSCRPPAPAAA